MLLYCLLIANDKSTGITSGTTRFGYVSHACTTIATVSFSIEVWAKRWVCEGLNHCLLGVEVAQFRISCRPFRVIESWLM